MKVCIHLALLALVGTLLSLPGAQVRLCGELDPISRDVLMEAGHELVREGGVTIVREGKGDSLQATLAHVLEIHYGRMAIHTHNLKNTRTVGFKKTQAEWISGEGLKISSLFSQGALCKTNNPFHLAIVGEGFFVLEQPDGSRLFTRDGDFRWTSGAITLRGHRMLEMENHYTQLTVSRTGKVSATSTEGDGRPEVIGQLRLALVEHPENLEDSGNGTYRETGETGSITIGVPGGMELGILEQGCLEYSNVNPVQETSLLEQARADALTTELLLQKLDPELVSSTATRAGRLGR